MNDYTDLRPGRTYSIDGGEWVYQAVVAGECLFVSSPPSAFSSVRSWPIEVVNIMIAMGLIES